MLEAERAGAKALVVYMDSFQRNSEHWKVLRQVQADEAHNCALIGKLLEKSGTAYSHATGEFYDKAVAVKGAKDRIGFLIKGLRWAMREFDAALPRMQDTSIQDLFRGMRERHARSAATCEAVLGKR
jgi:nitronate monooxygenase